MSAPPACDAGGVVPALAARDEVNLHGGADRCCRNRGARATRCFCPGCGQTTAVHPPTVAEFFREFREHHVAIEGSLWRTLAALLLVPGRLAVGYSAGRRARCIGPLRLDLTFGLIFFAVTNFAGGQRRSRSFEGPR